MKKYINNRLYNTDTAKEVAHWSTEWLTTNDFKYCEETLYLKSTGEYFLHGKGGALSAYSEVIDHASVCGEKIIPLGLEMAMEWAKEKLTADEYNEIFGEITEDTTNTRVTVSLPKNVLDMAKRKSQLTGLNNLSKYVEMLIVNDNKKC